jgi:hypothetical protein
MARYAISADGVAPSFKGAFIDAAEKAGAGLCGPTHRM